MRSWLKNVVLDFKSMMEVLYTVLYIDLKIMISKFGMDLFKFQDFELMTLLRFVRNEIQVFVIIVTHTCLMGKHKRLSLGLTLRHCHYKISIINSTAYCYGFVTRFLCKLPFIMCLTLSSYSSYIFCSWKLWNYYRKVHCSVFVMGKYNKHSWFEYKAIHGLKGYRNLEKFAHSRLDPVPLFKSPPKGEQHNATWIFYLL